MGKHIPGPWTLERDTHNALSVYAGKYFVGTVEHGADEHTPEEDGNAALIASAPELLAALQTMVAVLDGPVADLLTGDSMNDTGAYDALSVAREALHKAKGEKGCPGCGFVDEDESCVIRGKGCPNCGRLAK